MPSNRSSRPSTFRQEGIWFGISAFICAHFALIYDWSSRPFLNLQAYAAGQERSPFQERVLMAWIFRVTTRLPAIPRIAAHLPEQLHNPYIFIQLLSSLWLCLAQWPSLAARWGINRLIFLQQVGSINRRVHGLFQPVLIYGPASPLPYDVPASSSSLAACTVLSAGTTWPSICSLLWVHSTAKPSVS